MADKKTTASPARLLDLANFALAYYVYVEAKGRKDPHAKKGAQLAIRYAEGIEECLEKYIDPMIASGKIKRVQQKHKQSKRGKGATRLINQGNFLGTVFSRLSNRQETLNEIFTGKTRPASRDTITSIKQETPAAILHGLAGIPSMSGLQTPRAWIKEAANLLGAGLTDFDATVSDAESAVNLAEQIKSLDVAIRAGEPNDPEIVKKKSQRSRMAERVQKLAESSPNPDMVLGAAVSAMANKHTYSSPVAKRLGLSAPQEDAMLAEGKVVMAASAGAGKTRVLAGKVVYHMEEKGLSADQIMACSFTKKSSVELVERVRSYGGAIPKKNPLGFGTVHSVALRMFLQYGGNMVKQRSPGRNNLISGYRQMDLIKLAILQVMMDPSTTPEPPREDSFFESEGFTPIVEDEGSSTDDVIRALELVEDSYKWMAKTYGASRWLTNVLDGIDRYRLNPVAPEDMTQSQKDWVNRALGYAVRPGDKPRGNPLRNLERGGMSGFRVAKTSTDGSDDPDWAPSIRDKYTYWGVTPAEQWFNLGYSWEDFKVPYGEASVPIPLGQFALYISKKKGGLVSPGADAVTSPLYEEDGAISIFTAVYAAYEWLKSHEEEFASTNGDFSDMLLNASRMMIANPSARKRIQSRFKCILIDEAQDLNKSQHLFVGLVSGTYDPATQRPKEGAMTAETLAFIGDDAQAIYAFRGADPDQFIEKTEQGFDVKLLKMNYRSGNAIVEAGNRLIEHNKKQIKKVCDSHPNKGEGKIEEVVVQSMGDLGPHCADVIQDMVENAGSSYSDFGIALRTNREAYQYGVALIARGIPFRSKMNFFKGPAGDIVYMMQLADLGDEAYTVPGSVVNPLVLGILKAANWGVAHKTFVSNMPSGRNWMKFLAEGGGQGGRNRNRVRDFFVYLESLTRLKSSGEEGEVSTKGIYNWILNTPLGRDFKSMKESMMDRVRENPTDMEEIQSTAGKGGSENIESAIEEYALAPLNIIETVSGKYPDLQSFVSYMTDLQRANGKLFTDDSDEKNVENTNIDAVNIDTVHGWKGLETRHLFVPMWEGSETGGGFPHSRVISGDAPDASLVTSLEDERRLAYVAITRGEESVTIIRPAISPKGKELRSSRFVNEACIPRVVATGEVKDAPNKTSSLESNWGDYLIPEVP